MPILKVKVSEKTAKNFSSLNVVEIEELFSYYEDNEIEWTNIPIKMEAGKFRYKTFILKKLIF